MAARSKSILTVAASDLAAALVAAGLGLAAVAAFFVDLWIPGPVGSHCSVGCFAVA